ADYISHHVILDKVTFEHDLKDFSFSFIELPKFNIDKIEDLKTITEKWCYFFKYAANTSEADLQKIIGSDLVVGRAYEALNQFNWNEAELLAYEQEIKRIMDNKAVEDFMIESAEARGEAKGKAEGEYNKSIEVAKNMLAAGSDYDFISKVTGLSITEINKLRNE
ncbi:MAG: Rpn family recombination-promoting nuclease/putative transposase, partial [Rickettsia endosymbiont of Oxypoda opaca]|nr:Rpn family recombination-promoting nuclease/putative transposase [Rickettsia endosymbiont of Oxypoda opaca]